MTFKNRKLNLITIFFCIAYTLIIFSFSVGFSIVENQKLIIEKNNPNTNKVIVITSNNIKLEDIIAIVNNEVITLNAQVDVNLNKSESFKLTSNFINKRENLEDEIKIGEKFKKDDYTNKDNVAIFSSLMRLQDNKFKFSYADINGHIQEQQLISKGITYGTESKVLVNNNVFMDYIINCGLLARDIKLKINADKEDLVQIQSDISSNLKKIDSSAVIEFINDFQDDNEESGMLFKITFSILLIILLNSINITGLWVEKRKREIGIRKAVGATNNDLVKLLFKELLTIAIFSLLLVLIIQFILIKIDFFILFNLQVKMYFKNFIYSLLLAIIVSALTCLPAYYYLFKLQIIDVLSEE